MEWKALNNPAIFGVIGALSGFVGVAAGAFGAHALRERLPTALLQAFETGARYQMVHALVLVAIGIAFQRTPKPTLAGAGWFFVAGQVLFPGSLYALALTGERTWGAVTPFGGLCYLAGWLSLAVAFALSLERRE